MGPGDRYSAVIDDIAASLKVLAENDCRGFLCTENSLRILNGWAGEPAPEEDLDRIRENLSGCRRCRLGAGRTHLVFGSGDPSADLMFVGEGPGYEEDRTGEPFVGPAGRLLTKIIQAIGMQRETVFICNVVKCRPPDNRNPLPDEIRACRPFLDRQIAAVSPKFIVALGSFAARALLDSEAPLSRLRGRFHRLGDVQVLPTYHPAYLLRNPEKKRDVWEDMKMLMHVMAPVSPEKGDRR